MPLRGDIRASARLVPERLALQPDQMLRACNGEGGVLFHLGQHGLARQFRRPTLGLALAALDSSRILQVRP